MKSTRYQRAFLIGARTAATLAAGVALGVIVEANRPEGTYDQQRVATDLARTVGQMRAERCCHD